MRIDQRLYLCETAYTPKINDKDSFTFKSSSFFSSMMKQLADLRDKYDLHVTVERFVSDEYEADGKFVRE